MSSLRVNIAPPSPYFAPKPTVGYFKPISASNVCELPMLSRLIGFWVQEHDIVTLDFRPEVEIWPFRAFAMKHIHYNPYHMNNSVIVDCYGEGSTFHRTYQYF